MINKDSALPMDKICRSCMTEGPEMRSLYEQANTESIQFAEMIMACTTVQVKYLVMLLYNESRNNIIY